MSLLRTSLLCRCCPCVAGVRRFFQTKLPPGFPIRFEVPVVPSISAKVRDSRRDAVPSLSR
jgi:hypothetical protein